MRSVKILAVAFAVLSAASAAHADVFPQVRTISIDSGIFTGDNQVALFVINDGTNGSGSQLVHATVTESVYNGRSFDQLFIRTWNGSEADLSNEADRQGTDAGSYVRFGTVSQWMLDGSLPAENSQQFTDGQTLYGGLRVSGTIPGGADDTHALPLAVAVVPAGDLVRFDYSLDYANAPSVTGNWNNTLNHNDIPEFPFPEPATWSLVFLLSCYEILHRRGTGTARRSWSHIDRGAPHQSGRAVTTAVTDIRDGRWTYGAGREIILECGVLRTSPMAGREKIDGQSSTIKSWTYRPA